MRNLNSELNSINLSELRNIQVNIFNSEYIVTLTDTPDIEILKGYGKNVTDAMNDLFDNLI